jgi:hypothetical protein
MVSKQTRDAVVEYYKQNPDTKLQARDIAKIFGIDLGDPEKTSKCVRDLKRRALGSRRKKWSKEAKEVQEKVKEKLKDFINEVKSFKENFDKGTVESTITTTFEPKTIDDLYQEHKINSDLYTIKNYWSKKQPNGNFTSSVFAVRKTLDTAQPSEFVELLKEYESTYEPIDKTEICVNTTFTRPTCLILHLTDFHLDKQDIYGTTLEEKKKQFYDVATKLLYRAYQANYVDEIVFVLGSDMLHTDTYQGTTTNLTPQDSNTTWHNAFTEAFDIYANVIKILKQFCNTLNVILVPGNHDRTKSFYLAYGLEKYFETDSSILFDTNPTPRKIYTYGSTFIGLHHGDCKITDLPLIFAKEFSKEWGQCTYHQILTGDKHHVFEKEIQGVRVRQLPSLSKEDNWHNQSNYVNAVKAAMAIIYDKEHGCCMTIEERL